MKTVVAIISIIIGSANTAAACMCVSRLTAEAAYSKNSLVVAAKVDSLENSAVEYKTEDETRQIPVVKFTLETIKSYKGDLSGHLEILSRKTSCFKDLTVGKEYLLYVNKNSDALPEINVCNRVVPAENTQEDLQFLNSVK